MLDEIAYYACMVLAVAVIFRNLYLAVRAPWKPEDPREVRPPRSLITSEYLARTGAACILTGLLLLFVCGRL